MIYNCLSTNTNNGNDFVSMYLEINRIRPLSARDLFMKYLLILTFFLSCHPVQAQTCTGGLGDPITNITFGAGLDFGSPLVSGVTNMQYLTDQCPNDGQY